MRSDVWPQPAVAASVLSIPSEVEESLDISDHTAVGEIKRCLDFARHDKRGVPQL